MLNTQQILCIQAQLKHLKLEKEVEAELVDHYACIIEDLMLNQLSFEAALAISFEELQQAEVKEINHNFLRLKQLHKMKKALPFLGLFMLIGAIAISQMKDQAPTYQLPIAQENYVKMASGFGYRMHPIYKVKKLHRGMDFVAPMGTPVHSIMPGKVIKVTHDNKGYGNHIEVLHADSSVSKYAQLSKINVRLNQEVNQSDTIGLVGSSGTSTGPHLHFEIIKDGKYINPTGVDSVFVLTK